MYVKVRFCATNSMGPAWAQEKNIAGKFDLCPPPQKKKWRQQL